MAEWLRLQSLRRDWWLAIEPPPLGLSGVSVSCERISRDTLSRHQTATAALVSNDLVVRRPKKRGECTLLAEQLWSWQLQDGLEAAREIEVVHGTVRSILTKRQSGSR